MDTKWHGFTIIESVLVLAITGLVAAMVLVGIGTSLRAERYRDSVNQTVDYFQGQYNSVANISNDRPGDNKCTAAGITTTGGDGRGTSNCLILGYSLRSSNGQTIATKQVIARVDASKIDGEDLKTEQQTLVDSSLTESTTSTSYELDWGSKLLLSGNPARFSMLVVRAPLSGVVRTYINTSSDTATLASLLSSPAPSGGVSFCIDPSGVFNIGVEPNGVIIEQNASNSSGVRLQTAGAC